MLFWIFKPGNLDSTSIEFNAKLFLFPSMKKKSKDEKQQTSKEVGESLMFYV